MKLVNKNVVLLYRNGIEDITLRRLSAWSLTCPGKTAYGPLVIRFFFKPVYDTEGTQNVANFSIVAMKDWHFFTNQNLYGTPLRIWNSARGKVFYICLKILDLKPFSLSRNLRLQVAVYRQWYLIHWIENRRFLL